MRAWYRVLCGADVTRIGIYMQTVIVSCLLSRTPAIRPGVPELAVLHPECTGAPYNGVELFASAHVKECIWYSATKEPPAI